MQTFLPYADFTESARVLDNKRLGKQRVENLQIMIALTSGSRWSRHPAVKMWRGHECALLMYQNAICTEWTNRGFHDTCLFKTEAVHAHACVPLSQTLPTWVGDSAFHTAHRSNLLRKNFDHYAQFGWNISPDLPYVWPVNE